VILKIYRVAIANDLNDEMIELNLYIYNKQGTI